MYLEQDDGNFVKQGIADNYKQIQELKKQFQNLVVERGRISYKQYHSTMDYLEMIISRFRKPSFKKQIIPFSNILLSDEYIEGTVSFSLTSKIIRKIKIARFKIKTVWSINSRYTGLEKRRIVQEIKNDCVNYVSSQNINCATMKYLLVLLEHERYKDISGLMTEILFDSPISCFQSEFYKLINESRELVYELKEDSGGEYNIFDFQFKKVICSMVSNKYYDLIDQDSFACDVLDFIDRFGITSKWIAAQLGINYDNFTKFVRRKINLSKKDCYRLFNFIEEYEKRMSGFIN